ncbi:MAG: LysR family transcriptional regulator [Lachnospiraceae bacterium]|nr:LysR family transcriptional regulator [Lachnospiraceae bacterium]
MELRTLRYFLAVAREENMTEAARQLHVTQPTLSRQIMDLEEELGKPLFFRSNRRTILTEDGMHLRARAEEIISLVDATEMEFLSTENQIYGEVRIGAGESSAISYLTDTISKIKKRYPGIRYRFISGDSATIQELLDHNQIDFGLILENHHPELYETLMIPSHHYTGILVRKDDPLAQRPYITREMIAELPLIVSDRYNHHQDALTPWIRSDKNLPLNIVATYDLIYNASILVEHKIGYAVTIDGLVYTGEGSPFAFLPFSPDQVMNIQFIWRSHQLMSKACDYFLSEVKNDLLPPHA